MMKNSHKVAYVEKPLRYASPPPSRSKQCCKQKDRSLNGLFYMLVFFHNKNYIVPLQTCIILSAAPFEPEEFLNPLAIFLAFCL